MRFISTRVHGMLDYGGGLLLIAAPWLFGFANDGAATWVPVALGIGMIGAAMLTDYEFGLVRQIPMPVHLGVDAAAGLLLAVSPWLFGFYELVWIPHVVFGIAELLGAATTETRPGRRATGVSPG